MDRMDNNQTSRAGTSYNVRLMVTTALLFAFALVLSLVESSLPPVLIAVPGIKFGLSNIPVMYALFFLRKKQALMIAVLKALFVVLTRGLVAGSLSLSGGLLSLAVMILLMIIFKDSVSYLILSISGAVFHNLGQLMAISLIYSSVYVWAYLPILLPAGVAAGAATSTLLRFIMPVFKKMG